MTKAEIIEAIRDTAAKNGGEPYGQLRFEKETGIRVHEWRGKYWLRWSQALTEAGFTPNERNLPFASDFMLKRLAELTRECKHLPTYAEVRLAKINDETFPGAYSLNQRLGSSWRRAELLRDFANRNPEFADILDLLPSTSKVETDDPGASDSEDLEGFVYMLKFGKHYKIGKTSAVPRRHRQISLELPEAPSVVHYLRTDDPEGIERYWHQRFASFRTNGEWFALGPKEVRVFKRRKSM